ncbi:SapC family protein [Hoeflea sp. YIM 152468]|uniref:SapC family protein n=1 Tax=Hoeflea sp. YIM 152468 TaxID=3031759 RepID=UPI0023DC9C9A|nr:SapC family protein [Hoeflea sp. YIM 152468]MDF1608088.1 SapC family protein [Hoeflea sp. YIM 152468]
MPDRTLEKPDTFPLFYTAPEAVSPEQHGNKGLAQSTNFSFAASAIVIPLMAAEMPAAMRSYPIIFSGPDFMPMMITGIKEGENLFIDANGKWAEPHYVPAYIRRYPFILAGNETDDRLTLCIENDPARLKTIGAKPKKDINPLFENGKQAEAITSALAFCEQYQAMVVKTRQIMKLIAGSGLLAKRTSKITLADGKSFNITGFHLVDEARLRALGDEEFLTLRKSDALATIYCHLASMNSWTSLLHQASLRSH